MATVPVVKVQWASNYSELFWSLLQPVSRACWIAKLGLFASGLVLSSITSEAARIHAVASVDIIALFNYTTPLYSTLSTWNNMTVQYSTAPKASLGIFTFGIESTVLTSIIALACVYRRAYEILGV